RADGLSNQFRLRADEAIVFWGMTPPEVKYFGFTPYIADRDDGNGGRRQVAAGVSETLHDLVTGGGGSRVFPQRPPIIAAADAPTVGRVRDALTAAGAPKSAVNTIVFDPALTHPGLDESADRLSVLFRMALPADPAARDAYIANPGATLLRVTPRSEGRPNP